MNKTKTVVINIKTDHTFNDNAKIIINILDMTFLRKLNT